MRCQVFPNGLTLEDGVYKAEQWWESTGRELIRKLAAEDTPEDAGGMMNGEQWDKLNVKERHKIVSVWYENHGQYL